MDDGRETASRWSNRVARRPAVAAAAFFIGGIMCHPALVHAPGAWLICAALAALLARVRLDAPRISSAALAAAIFFAAVASAQLAAFRFARDDIAAFASDQQRAAKLELLLDRPLRIVGTNFQSAARPMPPKQVTTATVRRVLTRDGWRDATGEILVTLDPPNEALATGQTIRVCGMLQRPPPAMNPGAFDWAKYYRQQRIVASISVPHADAAVEIVERGRPSIIAAARESVRRALAAGFTSEQSLDHALLRALVLGDNDPELRDVQEKFRQTGTSHHLAISGMHVAVLGAVVYGVCRLLGMRPRTIVLVSMTFVILYGVVALPSPSVIRSVVLCGALAAGIAMGRSHDNLQLLAVSVIGMLAYDPLDLYNAGFQLSFGTVFGLILFNRRMLTLLGGDPTADEKVAIGLQKPERRVWLRYHARRIGLNILSPSLVAWGVSMPLIAYHFQQLNPWAVLASVLLAPPVFVALIGGFLKIILTALLPMFAPLWAACAAAPVAVMRNMVDGLAMLPGSDVPLPTNSLLFVVLYYALLLLPLAPAVRPRLRRTFRVAPGLAVLMLATIPLTGGAGAAPRDGSLRVTLLAVGAGQCAVIETPDGRVVLLDAGSVSLADPVRKCIAPFLRSRGRLRVDEIWLSHDDYDHTSAAAELIRAYDVPRVVVSTEFDRLATTSATAEALVETIRQRGVELRELRHREQVELGKGVTLDVLWPPQDASLDSNNTGLVLKLTYARRTVLFPSDIQQPAIAALLRDAPDRLRCDVLIAPHHGSAEANTAAFLNAADPLYIVSSNDRTRSQKQRQFDRLAGERPLFRTDRCGAVTIEIDRHGGVFVTPFVPPPP